MFRCPGKNLENIPPPCAMEGEEFPAYLFIYSKFWMDLAISKNFMETFFVFVRRLLLPELRSAGIMVSCIVPRLHLYSDALLDTPNADSRSQRLAREFDGV
jgi:hypothetical protein